MATANEIKNLALFTIGYADNIDFTDLADATVQKVNRIYDTSKNFVLSNYYWRFVQKRVKLTNPIEETDTFTADAGTEIITGSTDRTIFNGLEVELSSTGTLPDPLQEETIYYTITSSDNTCQLSVSAGGSAIDLTDAGSGTHTITFKAVELSPYTYLYETPTDLLALRHCYIDKENLSPINDYELNNNGFLCNDIQGSDRSIRMWYAANLSETLFPDYFLDYFRVKLALDLAFNLTGDTDLMKILSAQEQKMLISAKNVDAKQNKSRLIKSSPFTQIRY